MTSASLLTINTAVPAAERDGTPYVVVYDNGDWEIAFKGDVEYIAEQSLNFHSAQSFIEFFVGLMIFYEIGDIDDLDVADDLAYLMISRPVFAGRYDEPVLFIYQDGEMDVMDREVAENMIKHEPDVGFNFIPALDLFEDFRTFRSRYEDVMFSDTNDAEPVDDDAEPEEI